MKKFGICIVILTIIFTVLDRMNKYWECENFIFNTTMIINGNYYLVTKENMGVVRCLLYSGIIQILYLLFR